MHVHICALSFLTRVVFFCFRFGYVVRIDMKEEKKLSVILAWDVNMTVVYVCCSLASRAHLLKATSTKNVPTHKSNKCSAFFFISKKFALRISF